MEKAIKCSSCRYAIFVNYNEMKCEKGIVESNRNQCYQYCEDIDENEPFSYILSGKLNDQIEENKENVVKIEKEKQDKFSIIPLSNTENAPTDRIDRRIYTKKTVKVFSDLNLYRPVETIPPQNLVKYKREIIRNEKELLLVLNNESKCYIPRDSSAYRFCEHCITKDYPLDVILISHTDFDSNFFTAESGKHIVEDKFKDEITSLVEFKEGKTNIRIVNKISKGSKEVSSLNSLILNSELKNIQIARLESRSHFFISESTSHKNVKKIVTSEGREAILISPAESYKIISDPLWSSVTSLIIISSIALAIYLIINVLSNTGYFVFWAFGIIALCYVNIIILGLPIYTIINRIRKHL